MDKFFEIAPRIIEESAKSELGILALLILTASVIALIFFKKESVIIKAFIFFLLFSGFSSLAYSIRIESKKIAVIEEMGITNNAEFSAVASRIANEQCYKIQLNQIDAMKNIFKNEEELFRLESSVIERAEAIKQQVAFGKRAGSSIRNWDWFQWDKCGASPGGFRVINTGEVQDTGQNMISSGDGYLQSLNYKEAILEYRAAQTLFKSI